MPDSDFGRPQDRAVSERAKSNALIIYQQCGGRSLKAASVHSWDASESGEQRRYARLLRLEIERLDRLYRRGANRNGLVLWKPRLFSLAWFARCFGWLQTFGFVIGSDNAKAQR